MQLKLLVIRTADPKLLADFYSSLGFSFDYHQHGNGPYHYSATIDKTVLEIYPLTKYQVEADKNIRIGFAIDNFEATIQLLKDKNTIFVAEPAQTVFGFLAVVEDPDGRKVELYKE